MLVQLCFLANGYYVQFADNLNIRTLACVRAGVEACSHSAVRSSCRGMDRSDNSASVHLFEFFVSARD
jgi:hypothetical protein